MMNAHVNSDLEFSDCGTVILMAPMTSAGEQWIEDHLPNATRWAGVVVIEPRYLQAIVAGASADGLVCTG